MKEIIRLNFNHPVKFVLVLPRLEMFIDTELEKKEDVDKIVEMVIKCISPNFDYYNSIENKDERRLKSIKDTDIAIEDILCQLGYKLVSN